MSTIEVILPLRNPPAALERSIESLAGQTDRNFSVLLSENHSTRGADILESAAARLRAAAEMEQKTLAYRLETKLPWPKKGVATEIWRTTFQEGCL